MARCTFKINITVPRCRNLGALKDGYSICHTSFDMRKGTVCQFGCYDGHTLVGSSSTMCTQHGTWTTGLPKCDRTTCDPPLTATGEASVQCSDNNFYRSKCSYICAEGFDVTPGMTRVRVCTVHGTWRGKEPKCTDITRPLIRNCTGAVYGFAERGSTTGCLHWTEPSVFDNADKSIRLSRTGPSSDARLTAGTYDVKYNAEDESGNKAIQCTMKIIVKAVQLCEDNVLPPDYGAIACDYWLGGKFCQMLCKKGYDIPPGYTFPEMIVCSETGQWLPTSTLPDCAKTFSSQASSLAMDVHYYFEGDCSDANVLTSIKEKFIQALMTSTFRDACEVYTEKCYPGNVQVQCGSLSGKRSLSLNVKFDMKIVGKSSFGNMSFGRLNENIMKAINKHMNNDTFELLDLPNNETMKVQDFSHDSLRIVCNERMIPSYSSESCIECPPGTFYDRDTQSCPMCPVGEFQPSAASSACIHCPTEQTTHACSPGTFSYNGLPPCTPCPVGMYVDTYGTATCRVCPASSTTIAEGTHLKSDCKEFDIVFTSPAGKVVMPFKNASIDEQHIFAISFWINSPNHKLTGSIIQLNFPNSKEPFDISIDNDRLAVTGKGVTVSTTFMVNDTLWHSIVLHVEESTVEIYNGGAKSSIQYRSQASMAIKNIQEPYVVISGNISHLNVWSKGMKLENILEINSRCDIVYHGDLLAWKEFESVDGDDVFVQIPSECDDQNDCDVNSCNGGICKDELHAYSCVCPVGLSGDKCEINIDDCVDNACENNSTCVDGIGEYTCQCGIHFKGDLCEIAMVDGDWSVWSNWSVCSASCGNGTTVRKRLCNNPTPDHGGKDCVGENTDIMICNVENCTGYMQKIVPAI
ncbi:Sushi repeat-containing protein SRPX2 [Mizuhopecten yessoensis]|uniref:Sushi repeat-containing protein SRPX2 n=1 Tax=Mizuhopecten yessoensis TaxID=6573 RepID=A0A210QHD2_MIZYE|nr:Sushi repeat-containing protein SRPX2 [Mizuhopecten yessoensis]